MTSWTRAPHFAHDRSASLRMRSAAYGSATLPPGRTTCPSSVFGTPALLTRSGLGGAAVGRYLRLHPTTAVTGLYDRPILAGTGAPMTTICDAFSATGAHGYGFWLETPPTTPPLAAAALGGFGGDHAALLRDYTRTGALLVLVRDGADVGPVGRSTSVPLPPASPPLLPMAAPAATRVAKNPLGTVVSYAVLALFTFLAVYPILYIVTISLRPGDRLLSTSLDVIPEGATLDNFRELFTQTPFLRWMANSILITLVVTVTGVALASIG